MPLRIRSHITYPQKPKPVVEMKYHTTQDLGGSRHFWTITEDELVRKMYLSTKAAVLAERLGRSPDSIHDRARRLGLKKQHHAPGP